MHIALVGGSGFGRYHLQVWRKHPAVSRITLVGRDPARLAALGAEFGVDTTSELDVLTSADLVDVCTPPDTHYELALAAVRAGRPTIVEKPPCRTSALARQLAAEAGATPLFCVQNHRFSPLWQRVRQLVAAGEIGQPQLSLWSVLCDQTKLMAGTDFRADAQRGGGALLDGAFHHAYLLPPLLGGPITAATAWAGQLAVTAPAGEDTGLVIWELAGSVAQVTYSWAVANAPRSPAATIIGDEATLVVPRSAKQPLERLAGGESRELDLGPYRSTSRNDLGNCLDHYLQAVRQHTAPEATWADAVAAQEVIEATEAAAAEGRRVEVA